MIDPISDLLTRVRNAIMSGKKEIIVPASKMKFKVLLILKARGFIENVKKINIANKDNIKIALRYKNKIPAIQGIERVSKPGQRIYVRKKEIKSVLSGFGIGIISTSEGLLTDKEAKKRGLGGEYICKVW